MKKSVTIELDKARHLRYGINALCTIEEIINKFRFYIKQKSVPRGTLFYLSTKVN